MNGSFCWFDLNTTDPEAARAFYTALTGWTVDLHRPTEYAMWKKGDQTFGGVATLSADAKAMGAPPHWLGYVWVDNVDAAVAKATSLGATALVPGTDIGGDAGRFAILADPQGARIALYQSSNPTPGGDWKSPVTWRELYTADLDGAWAFYEAMFGWSKTESMTMPDGGVYQMFSTPGGGAGGMMKRPAEMPASAWTYYFTVDDADATTAKATGLGAKTMMGPMDVPGGDRITVMTDPQGAVFAVHSRKRA